MSASVQLPRRTDKSVDVPLTLLRARATIAIKIDYQFTTRLFQPGQGFSGRNASQIER
jgi:hypothetical protein